MSPSRRTPLKDRIRYKGPLMLVHLVLMTLGLLNLYPFLWMVGTSFKAEAESSTDRMRPLPGLKYRLSDTYELRSTLPSGLEPGLNDLEGDAFEAALPTLRSKLVVIDRLQRAASPSQVHTLIQSRASSADPEDLSRTLIETGLLDTQDDHMWVRPEAFEAAASEDLSPDQTKILRALVDSQSVTVREYAVLARLDEQGAARHLDALLDVGVMEQQSISSEEGPQAAYLLRKGAREAIEQDLYPRHILTLWDLHTENLKQAETRSTYAQSRIRVSEYAQKYSLASEEPALLELSGLQEAGYLTPASYQAMNYWVVLKGENILLNFMTTILLTAMVVLGTVLSSSMLGYALACLKFPGKFWVLGIMIFTSILPGEARVIPIFKMLLSINGLESLWGLMAWLTSFGVGNAMLMAGFFLTLPKEVNEAANVDGAGVFRTFFDIALPMAQPIVMTVGMFAFLTAWNNFMVPLLCTISRPSLQPLAVAVYNYQAGHPGKWHQINAAAAIMIIPVILGFLAVQKHVVKSIAVGAVKG